LLILEVRAMFQQSPQSSAGKGGVFNSAVSLLGTAAGIGVAILITPPIFGATRGPLFGYLTETWGHGIATALTWTMGGVEAVIVYVLVKLLVVLGGTFAAAALAAFGFPGAR
jgi:hypothetical protein